MSPNKDNETAPTASSFVKAKQNMKGQMQNE
jgi:hypothetical protein